MNLWMNSRNVLIFLFDPVVPHAPKSIAEHCVALASLIESLEIKFNLFFMFDYYFISYDKSFKKKK